MPIYKRREKLLFQDARHISTAPPSPPFCSGNSFQFGYRRETPRDTTKVFSGMSWPLIHVERGFFGWRIRSLWLRAHINFPTALFNKFLFSALFLSPPHSFKIESHLLRTARKKNVDDQKICSPMTGRTEFSHIFWENYLIPFSSPKGHMLHTFIGHHSRGEERALEIKTLLFSFPHI